MTNKQTIQEYLTNKEKRLNSLFRFINGEGYYVLKGAMIPAGELDLYFPLHERVYSINNRHSVDNPDGTKISR